MGTKAIKDARKIETNFVYSTSREQQVQTTLHGRAGPSHLANQDRVQAMSISPVVPGNASNVSDGNRIVPGLNANTRNANGTNNRRRDKSKFTGTLTTDSANGTEASSALAGPSGGADHALIPALNGPDLPKHNALTQRVVEAVGGSDKKLIAFRSAGEFY